MFHGFKRSKGVVFSGFLAFLLWGYEAGACLSTPDEIKLPGSSFTAERITVGKSLKKGYGIFTITFGNTALSYRRGNHCTNSGPTKECRMELCWFYHNQSQCLSNMIPEGHHVAIKAKDGREIGLVEIDNKSKTLHAYSTSSAGVKDTNKPYLKFREHKDFCNGKRPIGQPCPTGVNLTVTAHAGGRIIGKYSIRHDPKGPVARDLGVGSSQGQGHTGVIYLGNHKNFSSNGCGVNVKPLKSYRN